MDAYLEAEEGRRGQRAGPRRREAWRRHCCLAVSTAVAEEGKQRRLYSPCGVERALLQAYKHRQTN